MRLSSAPLACPSCGAQAQPESAQCEYCRSALATVACPSCFAMMFIGSKHCPHCGARAARVAVEGEESLAYACPRCRGVMARVKVGSVWLAECHECAGVWIAPEPFERICAEREQQAAVMAWAVPAARAAKTQSAETVRYLACPQCGKLMNRVNFARYSGVIMDVCRTHGTFFDRDELHGVIQFIRNGGLDLARGRERERLVQEQQRLRRMELQANSGRQSVPDSASAAGSRGTSLDQVLKHLFDPQD